MALVEYASDGHVARLTLNSPHNRNALSDGLVDDLLSGLRTAADDPEVRAIVLTHTGSTFCAGADLSAARSSSPESLRSRPAGTDDPLHAAVGRARTMAALLRSILETPLPVIGAIDGHVRAGGLGLVGACDIVVAGGRSTFALTEARIGVAPSIISLVLLPKMSARAAGRYFLTGERFGSAEAADVGLVTIATDDVDAAVDSLTDEIGAASPQGLAASKALTTAPILSGFAARAEDLSMSTARLFVSEEAAEGMAAFLQKRPPRWHNASTST